MEWINECIIGLLTALIKNDFENGSISTYLTGRIGQSFRLEIGIKYILNLQMMGKQYFDNIVRCLS